MNSNADGRSPPHLFRVEIVRLADAPELVGKLGARVRKLSEQKLRARDTFAHETGRARSFTSTIEVCKKDACLSTLFELRDILGFTLPQLLKNLE